MLYFCVGVGVDFIDQQGNTPLHYAAKYGHLDLCRFLIDRGAFAGKKNDQGQTAYDTAGSHTARQYLLPLHFQSERKNSLGSSPCNTCGDTYCQIPGHVTRSSNFPALAQSNQYGGEQQHMSYTPPSQYSVEQQHQTQYTQKQPIYSATVHTPHAPIASGTMSSTVPTVQPSVPMKNAPLNLPINIFSRNDSGNENKLSSRLTTSTSSGINSPRDTANNSTVASPAKPGSGVQANPFAPQTNHNGPSVQNHNPPIFTANSQSIRNNAAKVQVFSGGAIPTPTPTTQQTPPAQLISPNPHMHVPQQSPHLHVTQQSPHKSAPIQSPHQQITQGSYAAQPIYSTAPPPPTVQIPGVMQQAYKPTPTINSTNRIIQPGKPILNIQCCRLDRTYLILSKYRSVSLPHPTVFSYRLIYE